jgi:hypothetical protein
MPRLSLLVLLIALLCGCAAPIPTAIDTPAPTPTFISLLPTPTPTQTPTLTSTPKPAWETTIENQDGEHKYFTISSDGQPVIDLYDTQNRESITLNKDTVKITRTTDGLNPNILTAQDADSNLYALNPDLGWFKVPEVNMNYTKLAEYTEVEQSFIEDGRANIVTTLKYAENPTISPDAITPQYWVNYGADGNSNFIFISYRPGGGLGTAQKKWPDLLAKSYFKPENKPFALTGFYKVRLKTGETAYVVSRTLKTGNNQTTNLFYGWDKNIYETMANTILGDGTQSLKWCLFNIGDRGGDFFASILAPPKNDINGNPLSWNPDLVHRSNSPNPDVAKLQKRGQLISLFGVEDQKTMLDLLSLTPVEILPGNKVPLDTSPLDSLPPELSKFILLPGSD